tara:strand:- start:448 stop:699 length:252 start_codon:yes stop_codon:yes gene_type:complete
MIQAAIMSMSKSNVRMYRYQVGLMVEGRIVQFFVDNLENIPHELRDRMDTGDPVAGVFTFEPADQFAHYIDQETLQASWDRLL